MRTDSPVAKYTVGEVIGPSPDGPVVVSVNLVAFTDDQGVARQKILYILQQGTGLLPAVTELELELVRQDMFRLAGLLAG